MSNNTNKTVYISNLSYQRDRGGVRRLCARYGEVGNIKIVVEPTTEQSRGMAFVEMGTPAQAKLVIEGLNQQIIDGRTVKVKYATPLKEGSISKVKAQAKKEVVKDSDYVSKQLAKKARNELKRKSNPFRF